MIGLICRRGDHRREQLILVDFIQLKTSEGCRSSAAVEEAAWCASPMLLTAARWCVGSG
jgi:hypothetical protein